MSHIIIDPMTRIEGHLKVEAQVENGEVKDAGVPARSSGALNLSSRDEILAMPST